MNSKKENKLDGLHFYKLFKHHFADSPIELKQFGITPQNLDNDTNLYLSTIGIVTFYMGLLEKESKRTGVYSGPTYHHDKQLLKDLNSNNIKRLLTDTETKDFKDWAGRKNCYKLINHLGLR